MRYDKIECEIDELLSKGGLNPYERKLLRKIKRKMSKTRYNYRKVYKELTETIDRLHIDRHKMLSQHREQVEQSICYAKRIAELTRENKRLNIFLIFFFLINLFGVLSCHLFQ